MKKTEGYVIRKLEEEYVLLPTGKRAEEVNEVISLSETAGFIYLHAEEAASIPEQNWWEENMESKRRKSSRM